MARNATDQYRATRKVASDIIARSSHEELLELRATIESDLRRREERLREARTKANGGELLDSDWCRDAKVAAKARGDLLERVQLALTGTAARQVGHLPSRSDEIDGWTFRKCVCGFQLAMTPKGEVWWLRAIQPAVKLPDWTNLLAALATHCHRFPRPRPVADQEQSQAVSALLPTPSVESEKPQPAVASLPAPAPPAAKSKTKATKLSPPASTVVVHRRKTAPPTAP